MNKRVGGSIPGRFALLTFIMVAAGLLHAQEAAVEPDETQGTQDIQQSSKAPQTPDTRAVPEADEEIVVQGVRQADMNAREMERMKDILSSAIATDDLGNFADQNVAEALQRLPGVTLTKSDGQGEFVNVRGMGAGFVGVTLNNMELASSSSDSRAVGLNNIPADLMGSIEVFKSLTPDMDLSNIAAKVNVNSVTAFDRGDSLKLTIQGSMHEQRGESSPKATVVGTKLLAGETIGIAASLSYEERATEVNQIFSEDGMRYVRVSQPYFGPTRPTSVPVGSPVASSSREYMDRYFNSETFNGAPAGTDPFIDDSRMLTPLEFDIRLDESVRTRIGGTVDLGWRPTDDSEYFVRYAYTDYTDEELTLREGYSFGDGDARFVGYVNQGANVFAVADADLRHQILIEEFNDITETVSVGGENTFADSWMVEYEFQSSKSERENPNDRRVQFRITSLPMYGQLFVDNIIAGIITQSQMEQLLAVSGTTFSGAGVPGTSGYGAGGFGGYQFGSREQLDLAYDNLFLENGSRFDEVREALLNLRRDFNDGGFLNYIKGGVQLKERDRGRRLQRSDLNPIDFESYCEGDLECLNSANTRIGLGFDGETPFETYTPRNPRFDHDFITVEDAERLIEVTRVIPENLSPEQASVFNRSQNYDFYEERNAAYLMAEFQIAENTTLIAGARYAETEYGSTGFLTLRHDRFLLQEGIRRDIVIPLGDPNTGGFAVNEYDGVYPGLHLRYEPRDDVVVRAALWTNFNQPSFDATSARAQFDDRIVLCRDTPLNEGQPNERPRCSNNLEDDLGVPDAPNHVDYISDNLTLASGSINNALTLGNTDLVAMEATNLDASISVYEEDGDFFEVTLFYKDISDFIVDVRGLSVPRSELPLAVRQAIDQIDSTDGGAPTLTENVFRIPDNFVFNNVSTTINGNKAEVYGTELSYARFFTEGWLNGFFLQSNLTLQDSKANPGKTVRADETPLPEQADATANLTLGWENENYSVRLINNYRSEILKQIGTCSQADIDADAEWARLNDAGNSDSLPEATGSGAVYAERCQSWADVFHDDIYGLDIKATYEWSDFKFFLDILNVTEDVDVFYYRGNEHSNGRVLFRSEGLGRTFQLGMNYQF